MPSMSMDPASKLPLDELLPLHPLLCLLRPLVWAGLLGSQAARSRMGWSGSWAAKGTAYLVRRRYSSCQSYRARWDMQRRQNVSAGMACVPRML